MQLGTEISLLIPRFESIRWMEDPAKVECGVGRHNMDFVGGEEPKLDSMLVLWLFASWREYLLIQSRSSVRR